MTTYNTGNPIGSTDARDLYDNAQNFDSAINQDALTWVDRFGVTRPTFQGAIDDAATRAEFSAGDGSSKIGYTTTGTGAFATTVQEKLRETVSVTDFYANGVSGARVDPTGVIDSTAGIKAAIASITEGTIVFPAGDYKITDEITITTNNIHLIGLGTATLIVPSGVNTTTGVALNIYDNVSTQPVNIHIENINVDISSNSGGNSAGIRWGASYSSMKNVNVRIRGNNMTGVLVQTDDAGTGPYYNELEQVFVQGDSNSGTPLTVTKGFNLVSSTVTPSRSPNANTFIRCRAGGVYDAYDIKGAGNLFVGCTSEAINNRHYYCNHPSVSGGSIRNLIINPYCEQYPTSILFEANANASGCAVQNPYYTGVGTVFTDNSTLKNNRLIDVDTLPLAGSPVQRAAAKVTGTTVNRGFNVASVTTSGTGVFRVNFTSPMESADYFVSCLPASNDVMCRVSAYSADYIQLYFFNTAGAATNPTGFNVIVSR